MTKEKAIKKIYELAPKYAKTEDLMILREIDKLAYEYEIFICELDDGLAVEDDIFYFDR